MQNTGTQVRLTLYSPPSPLTSHHDSNTQRRASRSRARNRTPSSGSGALRCVARGVAVLGAPVPVGAGAGAGVGVGSGLGYLRAHRASRQRAVWAQDDDMFARTVFITRMMRMTSYVLYLLLSCLQFSLGICWVSFVGRRSLLAPPNDITVGKGTNYD